MSKHKLLLADDSITIQKVVNLTFADEGIEVVSVGDGDSAMEKFAEFKPDLVMVDVNMPGLNGYEVCEKIKQSDETRGIPVILLVGSFEPFDEKEAARVGANDFLTKPFQSIRQLVNKVTDLLNSGETAPEVEAPTSDSFTDTLEMDDKAEAPPELGDAGMDDEMIETNQVGNFAEDEEDGQFESSIYQPSPPEPPAQSDDFAKTQPLTTEDLKQFSFTRPEAETEELSQPEMETRESSEAEALQYEEEISAPETDDSAMSETLAFKEDFSEETEAIEEEPPVFADDTEISDLPEETVEESAEEVEESAPVEDIREEEIVMEDAAAETMTGETFEEPSKAEEISAMPPPAATEEIYPVSDEAEEESVMKEDQSTETDNEFRVSGSIPALDLDNGDLLELPPLVEETGIRPPAEIPEIKAEPVEEVETEPEVAEAEIPSVESKETASAAEAVLQYFPPELIEAIAQRVAEKISDQAIKDIAWEVVPQMAELIIKKMAEENLDKKKSE